MFPRKDQCLRQGMFLHDRLRVVWFWRRVMICLINSCLFRLQRNYGTVGTFINPFTSLSYPRRSSTVSGKGLVALISANVDICQGCRFRPSPMNTDYFYFNTRSEGSLIFFCSPFASSSSSPKDPRYCTWIHSCESGIALFCAGSRRSPVVDISILTFLEKPVAACYNALLRSEIKILWKK